MRLSTKTILAALLTPAAALASPDGTDPTVPAPSPAPVVTPVPAAAPVPPETLYEAAAPAPAPATIVRRTGTGTDTLYGREGVRELGASAGLTLASNLRDVNFSPSLGFFLNDNFEVSGILSFSNVKAGNESSTVWSALVEPSFHFAMDRSLFAFVGVGIGAAYIDRLGTALAVAPRAGFNFVVGKSGVLTPSLSYEYTMHDTMTVRAPDGTTDVTLLAVSSALRANIGYSHAW